MITTTVHCAYCGSDGLVHNGRAPNGKQKYLCRTCQRQSREHPTPHVYPQERREEILRAYEERSSLRGLQRTFGVSRHTVAVWIKKTVQLPPLSETLIAPDPTNPASTILELNELWSFISHRGGHSRVCRSGYQPSYSRASRGHSSSSLSTGRRGVFPRAHLLLRWRMDPWNS